MFVWSQPVKPTATQTQATYSHALVACSAVGCWEVALEILAATNLQREIQLSNGDLGCNKSLGKPEKKNG